MALPFQLLEFNFGQKEWNPISDGYLILENDIKCFTRQNRNLMTIKISERPKFKSLTTQFYQYENNGQLLGFNFASAANGLIFNDFVTTLILDDKGENFCAIPIFQIIFGFIAALSTVELLAYLNWGIYQLQWFKTIHKTIPIHPTILSLIGINLTVFAAWQVPIMHKPMSKYFMCGTITHSSKSHLHHYVSWLFSTCSHKDITHLVRNTLALQFLAPIMLSQLETPHFLRFLFESAYYQEETLHFARFFIGSAFFSKMASLLYKKHLKVLRQSLGLSGVLMAMLAFAALKYPERKVQFLFIPVPFELKTTLTITVAIDILGVLFDKLNLSLRWRSNIDHVSHLGGILAGSLYFQIFK